MQISVLAFTYRFHEYCSLSASTGMQTNKQTGEQTTKGHRQTSGDINKPT